MIVTVIQFLQSRLSVIPGKVVDMKIDICLLKKIPVHYSGGKSLNKRFEAYSLNFTNTPENRIGRKKLFPSVKYSVKVRLKKDSACTMYSSMMQKRLWFGCLEDLER